MNLEISLRHLEHTEAIDEKIKSKMQKMVRRHFSDNASFKWTSWVEHEEHYSTLLAHDKGKEFFVKAHADNLYKTIDMAVQKMESQVGHAH